jgi:hypothetical protein
MKPEPKTPPKFSFLRWVKRLGFAGFMFFLIKGLLWLLVPALAGWWYLQ